MIRHVVVVTYGEPPDPVFTDQLVYSWRILLGLTLTVAPGKRTTQWKLERYRSPLEAITRQQARDLRGALTRLAPGEEWRVREAYEFREPLLRDVLSRLPDDEPVTVVPMYVADSAFTHQISRSTAERPRTRARLAPIRVLEPLAEEDFAEVAAAHVIAEIEREGVGGPEWGLLLAAHGTLLEPPRPTETGRLATERVAKAIQDRVRGRFGRVSLGWLNHVYGGRWTEPPVEAALASFSELGIRRVVYFPFGFMADNAESELEGRIVLRTRGWLDAHHLPCVNDSSALAETLARQVVTAAEQAATVTGP
ncbi:MAG: ferrochelatase [Candidatus Eisenbacteria bacterium]|uniref:Ferrochelatase n=1 Tax=Eiseniibacteriota bacterium TaxID=2212470 RepID=A0A538UB91_UNCEI|nr:MAG: ferrochelatase [Candidatus Eisenbacteria bacterium]